MNDYIARALRARKVMLGKDFYQRRQVKRSRMTLGNRYADWTFCPHDLDTNSVIYSFGVGEDISFDLGLMEQFHLQVHAFDPSPGSQAWVDSQELPASFHFYPFGLAGKDGNLVFAEPAEPGISSLRMTDPGEQGEDELTTHSLPVLRLPTILERLGHERIDLLKMDIEGAEYDVIGDIVASRVPIVQVLIEFHHRFEHIGVSRTRQAIREMNEAGYLIFNVSETGEEVSFIKSDS